MSGVINSPLAQRLVNFHPQQSHLLLEEMHRGQLSGSEHKVRVHLKSSRTNSDLSLRSLSDLYTTFLFDALIVLDRL